MFLKRPEPYDAIVVGSGPAGSMTARELTKAGARVLLLEAGREVPTSEFAGHKWPVRVSAPWHMDREAGALLPGSHFRQHPI